MPTPTANHAAPRPALPIVLAALLALTVPEPRRNAKPQTTQLNDSVHQDYEMYVRAQWIA